MSLATLDGASAPDDGRDSVGTLLTGIRELGQSPATPTANLNESQELFRLAVESCHCGMVMFDADDKIILVNTAVEETFGYARADLIGRPVETLVPERLRAEHVDRRDGFAAEPEARPLGKTRNLTGRHKDGSEFPVAVTLNPIHTGAGLLVLAVIVDVSKEQESERHLAYMEARYRGLLEAAPDAMVVVNGDGDIVLLNLQAEKQFGYRRDELVGHKVSDIIPEGFAERLRADALRSAEEALAQKIGTGIELFGQRKDGSEFPIEIMLSPLASAEGLLVTAAIRNITVRKGMDRLKGEFVSTVSHELRTPLTSIAGALGLLAGDQAGKLPDAAARLVAIAHANSQRLVRLINDILDIDKLESGQVLFKIKRLEVQALVEQAIEAMRGFAEGFSVRVEISTKPDAKLSVRADPDRLLQVIINLLSNAIKFSPAGGEVSVAIERRGTAVRIAVRDHGPGIPGEFRPRIFEKFAQADATDARQKGGTGLGLSIVKQITMRLGGKVGFDDAPGGGTIFHLELPSLDHLEGPGIDVEKIADPTRVLLFEPDPDAARVLRAGLQEGGFATDLVSTASAAVTFAVAAEYDAVVGDLDAPDADCIELIRRLREEGKNPMAQIIVISADLIAGQADSPWPGLNVKRFAKPADIDQLVGAIKNQLSRRSVARPMVLDVANDLDGRRKLAEALDPTVELIPVDTIPERSG